MTNDEREKLRNWTAKRFDNIRFTRAVNVAYILVALLILITFILQVINRVVT